MALTAIRDNETSPNFSVRSRRYRYTLCGNGEEELYDHKKDPNEWTNLAGNTEYETTKMQLRSELMSILNTSSMPKNFMPGKAIGSDTK